MGTLPGNAKRPTGLVVSGFTRCPLLISTLPLETAPHNSHSHPPTSLQSQLESVCSPSWPLQGPWGPPFRTPGGRVSTVCVQVALPPAQIHPHNSRRHHACLPHTRACSSLTHSASPLPTPFHLSACWGSDPTPGASAWTPVPAVAGLPAEWVTVHSQPAGALKGRPRLWWWHCVVKAHRRT